jgi:hypothetical protein
VHEELTLHAQLDSQFIYTLNCWITDCNCSAIPYNEAAESLISSIDANCSSVQAEASCVLPATISVNRNGVDRLNNLFCTGGFITNSS